MKAPSLESPLPQPYVLGEWLVSPSLDRLEREGETVHLEPKWMDTLNALAGHPGEVLTRSQLLREVWGGSFVAESTLSRTIAELRRCLGDDAHQPRYIETVPRRGYRLMQPVTPSAGNGCAPSSIGGCAPSRIGGGLPADAASPLAPAPPTSPWFGFLAGAACCGLALVAARWTVRRPTGRRRAQPNP